MNPVLDGGLPAASKERIGLNALRGDFSLPSFDLAREMRSPEAAS